MLKWVKSNLETKTSSSKKGGVVVVKGKTKKKSANPENGTPRNTSSKTSSAPVAGYPPPPIGKGWSPSNSASPPRPPPPNNGGQIPPPSMSNISNSPSTSGAQLSMDKRSSRSLHEGSASQAYPESSGHSSDQNPYLVNDYSCSGQQSHSPSYDDQCVDVPPYSNSHNSNQPYIENSSNYSSHVKPDDNRYASDSTIDHQLYEYESYPSRECASSSSTLQNHQSSPYIDSSSAHDPGPPSSSHGHGLPPPSYEHSGTPSYSHSGPSSPHAHGGHSNPHLHDGHSSPHAHGGHSSPHAHGGHSSPHVHDGHSSPHVHDGHSSPHVHDGHSSPHVHDGHSSPHVHDGHSSPHVHDGHSSPHVHDGHSSPHVHDGHSSPHVHDGHSSPHVHDGHSSPHVHDGHSSPHVHDGHSSPHVHDGHSSPHVHDGHSSPHVHDGHSSPHVHDGHSSPHVHDGHSSPHVHDGHSSPHVHDGHSSPHVHDGHTSPHVHDGHTSPHVHDGHSSPHVHGGHSSPHVHAGHSSPHVHAGHSSPHVHAGHSSPHVHAGHSSPHVHGGHSSPHVHGGHSSPHVHGGHSSPHVHGGHSSPHVQGGHSSPHVQGGHSSPHVQGGHSSPHVQGGHSSPHVQGGHSSPHVQGGHSSPHVQGGHSSPHVQGGHSSPHVHGGHSSPHVHGGHSSPHVHGGPPSPHVHGGPPSPHVHCGPPSSHVHGGPPSSHVHGGPPSPHVHGGPPSPHVHGGPPSSHVHGGPPSSHVHGGPPSSHVHGGPPSSHVHGGPPSSHVHGGPPSSHVHGGPPSSHVHGGPPSSHVHGGPPSSHVHGGPPSSHVHGGPPSSHVHGGPPSPHVHGGPPSPHVHGGPLSSKNQTRQSSHVLTAQPSSDVHDSSLYASQHCNNGYNSYPQYNEDQQSSDNYSYSTKGYSNGHQQPCPQHKSHVSTPKTPKGHYNPENVDNSSQVSTPLKHISKSLPVKKPPRSPKTPISLPFRAREAPSPSVAAKAIKNSPIENYTNISQSLPSKSGPQIPYKEMLPKSPKKEVFVTFPDGQMIKQFVDPNMAMMDLLIQLTAIKRLNPSGYLLVALSEEGNRPVDYKANQPVGLVDSHRVKLMSKERVKTHQMSHTGKNTEKQLPFEGYDYEIYQPGPQLVSPNQMTYRLTVNLPHSQKVVRRMSANHPLYELHESVCEEKNLDPNIFVFQLPDRPTSQVNLKYTLQELGLENYELNLVHKAEMDHYMSVPNLSQTGPNWTYDQSAVKPSTNATYVHMPPPGETRKKKGFFSFLRKDKRGKSSSDLLNNRSSGKSRPASMFSPSTDTSEGHLKNPTKSSKKKPAPPPPTGQSAATGMPMQQQLSNYPPGEAVNSDTDKDYHTLPMHAQSRSDSGKYYQQKSGGDSVHQPSKLGTDSITYMKDGGSRNNFRASPMSKHQYVSAVLQSTPVHDDHSPRSNRGKTVPPASPRGLSVQLKTANDMYASPCKKRKPAPLPPPGGPQVRPKFDIITSTSAPGRYCPDIPITSSQSVPNALDKPNSSNSATAENVQAQNHASRTPLITVKTGPFTIENESSIPLKEDDKDIGIESNDRGNERRVGIMDQKDGCKKKLEFPQDEDQNMELIVEELSIGSKVDEPLQIKGNELRVNNSDEREIHCFVEENPIQERNGYLIGQIDIQPAEKIIETRVEKEKVPIRRESIAQTNDLSGESLLPFQVESSELNGKTVALVDVGVESPMDTSAQIEVNNLEEEESRVYVETSEKVAATTEKSYLVVENPAQKEATNLGPAGEETDTDTKIEILATKDVSTELTTENSVQEMRELKEGIPSEMEVAETLLQPVISDSQLESTDLNFIETPTESKNSDLIVETLIHEKCSGLNLESSFQAKGTNVVVENVHPEKITGSREVENLSTRTEGTLFDIEILAQERSANLKIEPTSQEKIPDFIVENQAQEDINVIFEKAAQDEGPDLEKDAQKMVEPIPLDDLDTGQFGADDEFATSETNHNGEEVDIIRLQRPRCSFHAPPPPISPPPAEPPTDIPSPIIIIGTEMVDKSVGISEDSTSLIASDASPPGGHARSLSKVSTISSIGTVEEVTFAFDETIAVAEEALQNELMEQSKSRQSKEDMEQLQTESTLSVKVSPNKASPTIQMRELRLKENGSPVTKFQGTPTHLTPRRDSEISTDFDESVDTVATDITIDSPSQRKNTCDLNSISSDGSFTTYGASELSTNEVHITEAEVNNVLDEVPEAEVDTFLNEVPKAEVDTFLNEVPEAEVNNVLNEVPEIRLNRNDVDDIQMPISERFPNSPADNEKISNGKTSVIETEHFQVNGIDIGIEKTVALTKTKIGQQVTVIRPNLETNATLELSRSSSAAELAQYMESPKEEVVLTKQDREHLDYRGSPLIEVQKKLEEELKKDVTSSEGSPKVTIERSSLSLESDPEIRSSDVETGPQGNLKKQIERWQKQLQEHLSDNSGLYTPQEQGRLKQKVDQWNKQLKELNVMDTSGFKLLEQNLLKQQIELWQRKLLAKERQYDGKKKFQEQEIEFLKKQIAVWKKKIEVIEKSATLYTIEERDVLQQQIELWQSQLVKNDNMDTHEKEQNLLKRQIEVWKKNLKNKTFAGHTFSQQEQDILKRQLNAWQKQLQWLKTGDAAMKSEILREQISVWQLQLLDVQKNPSEDSVTEQEILEQQIELWLSKLNRKDPLSEDIMLKQIDIWKRQTDGNRNVDDKYLVQEQMIIEKEIQLWNKRLSGEDVECESFIALEQDLLHEKIDLCQQKLKNNVEIDCPDMPFEQEILKLQVDLWQQKVSAMQEKKLAMVNYKKEEQDILKFQIKLWEEKLLEPSEQDDALAQSERGTELLAQEVDLWQRWLDVKKEKREDRIKFQLLDEELQKEQIRLWQDHLNVIKNDTLGYTEEEREILMQQIELWQKGLIEKKDGKTIHLAAEQDILKKYIDLWYNKMRRNTASSISEERDDVRQQIEIWKMQLTMYTLDDSPLSHSARQDIINQQINIWQKKRERCSVDDNELIRIESEILEQQIELWQKDLRDYTDKEMPKEQIKLLKRTLSQRKRDMDPEILARENAIVNRQIDLYQKKLDNRAELDSNDFINDEQKILEQQIDLWHCKLGLPDEGKAFYSESEYDILQKQVSLWHQQLVAIQHRQECQRKLAIQEQNLLKEQIKLWEIKLDAFTDPVFMVEEQDAMKDQIELWQQQLEEHKSIILNKTASTPDDPELRKMELMLRSQEDIIQSFKEGLKNLPENLRTRASPPSVSSPPVPPKQTKPVPKCNVEFPPPPDTFRDPEDFTAVKLKQIVPKPPPKPHIPPPLTEALANLKKVSPPTESPISPVKKENEEESVQRAVPAVVLKKPALARKPKRKLPEPVLSPREELMLEIKGFSGRTNLKGVKLKDTKWSGTSYS